jgi:hypothetical protein
MKYKIPRRYKGKFKMFGMHIKGLIYTGASAFVSILLITAFVTKEKYLFAVLSAFIVVPFYIFGNKKILHTEQENGGLDYDTVFFRRLMHSFTKRVYLKNINKGL